MEQIAHRSSASAACGDQMPSEKQSVLKLNVMNEPYLDQGWRWREDNGYTKMVELHPEVLAHVMLALNVKESCTAAQVCKAWHAAVNLSCRMTTVLRMGASNCMWRVENLTSLFSKYSLLQELHLSTELLLPVEAIRAIASLLGSSLRCLSGFMVSNCVEGEQPAVLELAKIHSLEELRLEGTLLTGQSLLELAQQCTNLKKLSCHEILATSEQLRQITTYCPNLVSLGEVNLSVHNELEGLTPEPATQSLAQLSKLKSLGVNLFTEQDDSVIRSIGSTSCRNLTSLGLRACGFSPQALVDCVALCSRLETLNLVAWDEGRGLDEFLCELQPQHLLSLQSLDLDEDQVSDKGLAALARLPVAGNLTCLECLDIWNVKLTTFEQLMTSMSSLRRLRIGVSDQSPWLEKQQVEGGVECALPQLGAQDSLQQLESLAICWVGERWRRSQPSPPLAIRGLASLPGVRRLELSDWPLLAPEDVESYASKASSLRHFTLSLPQDITSGALRGIPQHCTELNTFCLILFLDSMSKDFKGSEGEKDQRLEEIRQLFGTRLPKCRCYIDIQ